MLNMYRVRPPISVPEPNCVLSIEIHERHTNRGSYPSTAISKSFKRIFSFIKFISNISIFFSTYRNKNDLILTNTEV